MAPENYRIVPDKVIPFLEKELKSASKDGDSHRMLVYIRALGLLNHPAILKVYEPYLEYERNSTEFQRLAIIVALQKLGFYYPKLTRALYYNVYGNSAERYEVRAAAIFGIMRTYPDSVLLQRMAETANVESSKHISAAIRTALESCAELDHPEDREFADDCEAARQILHFDEEDREGYQFSRTTIQDWISDEMNLAYKMQSSHVGSEDSLIPKSMFLRITKNLGGYKNRWNDYHAMVSSVDELFTLTRNIYKREVKEKKYQPVGKGAGKFSIDQIEDMLNLQTDEREEIEGEFESRLGNSGHRGHPRAPEGTQGHPRAPEDF